MTSWFAIQTYSAIGPLKEVFQRWVSECLVEGVNLQLCQWPVQINIVSWCFFEFVGWPIGLQQFVLHQRLCYVICSSVCCVCCYYYYMTSFPRHIQCWECIWIQSLHVYWRRQWWRISVSQWSVVRNGVTNAKWVTKNYIAHRITQQEHSSDNAPSEHQQILLLRWNFSSESAMKHGYG